MSKIPALPVNVVTAGPLAVPVPAGAPDLVGAILAVVELVSTRDTTAVVVGATEVIRRETMADPKGAVAAILAAMGIGEPFSG